SGGGSIVIDRAGGTIDCATAGGEILVREARGAVTLNDEGGNIGIDRAFGPVQAHSAQGVIRVNGAGPMTLMTGAGSIPAELMGGGRLQDSSLVAGYGDIKVGIPSNLAVSVMARSDNALPRISSDYPEIRQPSFFRQAVVPLGALNGGGPVLLLNAGSGV